MRSDLLERCRNCQTREECGHCLAEVLEVYYKTVWPQVVNIRRVRVDEIATDEEAEYWRRAANYIYRRMLAPNALLTMDNLTTINNLLTGGREHITKIQPRFSDMSARISGPVGMKNSGLRTDAVSLVRFEPKSIAIITGLQDPRRQYALDILQGTTRPEWRIINQILISEGWLNPKDLANQPLREELWNRYIKRSMHFADIYIAPPHELVPRLLENFVKRINHQQALINASSGAVRRQHLISTAAYIVGELGRIHPFVKGNGRTNRLLLNWFLVRNLQSPWLLHLDELNQAVDEAVLKYVLMQMPAIRHVDPAVYEASYIDTSDGAWLEPLRRLFDRTL